MSDKGNGQGSSGGNQNSEGCCGYEKGYQFHEESYWADKVDPRETADQWKYNTHFEKNYQRVVDRQIADNHATHCVPQQQQQQQNQGGNHQKK